MTDTYSQKNSPIVRRIFFTMLVPTILMNLTTALASFADTVIIGYFLDDLSLSVVTYATPIYMIINTFAALFAVGGSICMGIDSGKGDKTGANRSFSIAVELLVTTGLLLTVGGVLFSRLLPGWLGVGSDASGQAVFEMVRAYSTIIMLSAPVFMLNVGLAFFVRNDGQPNLSMVGMMLSIVVNIVFDVIFIAVFDLGVAGAACATVLGQLVSALVIASHFLSGKNTLQFRFAFGAEVMRIMKNGGSTALHFVYQFLTILILNHLITNLAGANGVVVYTVVFNLYTVSLALFEGISQTIQPMISLFYGEMNIGKIKQTMKLAFYTIFVICGLVTLGLEACPQVVPMIFSVKDAALVASCSVAVRIFSASMIIMTINVVIGYYLQSTEQSLLAAVLVSLRCFVIFLLCVFTLGAMFGLNGIWASYAVAEGVTLLLYLLFNELLRKKMGQKNGEVNFLLLSKAVERSTSSYTFEAGQGDANAFIACVTKRLSQCKGMPGTIQKNTALYLEDLLCHIQERKGKWLEVDIVEAEGRVIVRDDLDHSQVAEKVQSYLLGEESDYSPALGFNRLCLK